MIVPAPVLAEVDYFLRDNRAAMRKLLAEILDPATRYDYVLPLPSDLVRALEFDAKFNERWSWVGRRYDRRAYRTAQSLSSVDHPIISTSARSA